jgi:hypothetical protein
MALRWIDSFDYISEETVLVSKYDPAESAVVLAFATGRTGPECVALATFQRLVTKSLPVSGTTAIVGVAFYMPAGSLTTINENLITIQEGSITHMSVKIEYTPAYGSQFKFTVVRDTTVLGTTAAFYPANTWLYLEFKTLIHASAGTYELRIDTVPVVTGSGVTSVGGTPVWDRVGLWGCVTGSALIYCDDFYICDGSSATRNNFLGIQRVEAVLMRTDAAGIGTHQEWTPSSGTDHGAMVDETVPDGDTTYNAATAAAKDSYQHTALTLTGTLQGVQVNPYWRKTDAGACTARTLARVGGTTYSGTTQSPLTTYSIMPEVLEVNPAGGEWTAASFNAAEFGVERVT